MGIQSKNSEIIKILIRWLGRLKRNVKYLLFLFRQKIFFKQNINKINLCSGNIRIPGYFNIDIANVADLPVNLAKKNLPLPDNSVDAVVCISAINYFSRQRASELIKEVYRILKSGGITRFGVQDLELLANLYIKKDRNFFFQKLPDGRERFEGPTIGDKFVAWFYGYESGGYPCQYFYDYQSLAYLFEEANFSSIERKKYKDSELSHIDLIDNRPGQMFFLEAKK